MPSTPFYAFTDGIVPEILGGRGPLWRIVSEYRARAWMLPSRQLPTITPPTYQPYNCNWLGRMKWTPEEKFVLLFEAAKRAMLVAEALHEDIDGRCDGFGTGHRPTDRH